ncbi:MAG: hypothetical protein A2503_10220 [Burkholderiales bacterium RIFOXYD12_FULL_59_19]|nr:MAG: hypothetical protein A2503_10220 [Burkholderiales bacterium RIFOXYD12_FULL_59_19]
MPILSGDIKLVASQVMDDVIEGGGAPTANVIADGVSNAIFPDISELDRAGGRVNMRKLFVGVQTLDTDTYMGSNIIVAEPPADPNVSVTLFTTSDTFDRRGAAASRVESYLNRGPVWGGMLLEDHITGQGAIQLLQTKDTELPSVGQTLVLVQNEQTSGEYSQYIRTTAVEVIERTYYDGAGKAVICWVVTCTLSDALRYDFVGNPGNYSLASIPAACKVRDTVVADAGVYVGVSPLASAASLGAFTVAAESVFTQLVPSAQTESPITDVRTNGLSNALVATGDAVSQSLTMVFSTTTSMFVGGPIYPGSLSVVRSGITAVDSGGLLKVAGVEVGQVDYDNGILSLSTNPWGTSGGTHTVTFVPAAVPDLISDQRAIRVTVESRAMNYTFVMDDVPVARTLSISYLAQGRWYVLRDNGAGVLSGVSSAYGVGTINYTTGSVAITLGALPDVGSSIVVQSFSEVTTVRASNTTLLNNGHVYVPINSDGLISTEKGAKSYEPGTVSVTWNDGTARTATDAGTGLLAGDATGTIDYSTGVVLLSPNTLPAAGTMISVSHNLHDTAIAVGVTLAGGNLGATNITPGSISGDIPITFLYSVAGFNLIFNARTVTAKLTDDGVGNLLLDGAQAGSITYATGAIAMTAPTSLGNNDIAGPGGHQTGFWWRYSFSWTNLVAAYGAIRTATLGAVNGNISYANTASAANTVSVAVSQYFAKPLMVPNYTLKGVGFTLGTTRYQQLTDGTLVKDIDPLAGGGTPCGSVAGPSGIVTIGAWPADTPSLITNWRALIAPPSVGAQAPFTAFSSTFRTASSPLRPGSFSVLGTMQDGTTFNVTADTSGKIDGPRVKGRIDYQYGLVEMYFVNPAGDVALNMDLAFLTIPGLSTIPQDLVMLNSIRYNAVAYSYLPLDASLLGIDPVRLPSDGRVPIFRAGGFAVVGHTGKITATVSNAQVIDCARVRLSRVRVIGNNGGVINTGYTADLDAGLVTFVDVTGYSQPVTIEHRIEDMAVVREAQISGEITFTRALTHDYPLTNPPTSFVSSALVAGDLKSRVSVLFDQSTWNGTTWLDVLSGTAATGTFNDVLAPIVVTNMGAVSERWALVFTNTTSYNVVGEHVGVIATGSVNADCAPINPATSVPYFTVPALGWGLGWSTGNILRFNTVGAMAPVWVVRTIQQGPNTGTEHSFTLLSRGDVDRA